MERDRIETRREGEREIEIEKRQNEGGRERGREGERERENGEVEGMGEGRRGNGIVVSPASSSSDPQSREFVRRMRVIRVGTLPRGSIKSRSARGRFASSCGKHCSPDDAEARF